MNNNETQVLLVAAPKEDVIKYEKMDKVFSNSACLRDVHWYVFENNKDSVDLVILDMRMPYNGGRAFDQLKQIKSDVKVIIASGYTEDQRIRDMYEQGCIGFIQKPFRINILSEKILKALQN